MSTPKLKKDPATGIQYIHWSEGRRSKRVSTGERDVKNAELFLANWMLVKHAAPAENGDEMAVRHYWEVYRQKHEVAGAETRDWVWKNLEVHFGDLKPSSIDEDTVWDDDKGYVVRRMKGLIGRPAQHSTIRRELVALRACLNWCADPKRKLLLPATLPAFTLPDNGEPRDRWLRSEEIQRCLNTARDRRRYDRLSRGERFLWIALETAARKTAILQLTWDRVDFETGVIHYDVPGRKKTNKKRSNVPISSALRPILERAFKERESEFVMDHGGEIDKTIERIGEQAGVAGLTPHVLRHTAATHMARRGVSLWKIAGILGNSVAMVEKVYAKHAPDGLRDAVDMISGGTLEPAE